MAVRIECEPVIVLDEQWNSEQPIGVSESAAAIASAVDADDPIASAPPPPWSADAGRTADGSLT